jgi:phage terminase small subunit
MRKKEQELVEKLSERQVLFARHVASGKEYTQSARLAGYPHPNIKYAALLKQEKIQNLIKYYQEEHRREASMTRKKVMDGFLESIDLARMSGEAGVMVAGWREIAKMCGYYAPEKKQIDVNITAKRMVDRLETMSDAELAELIEQDSQLIEGEAVEVLEALDGPDSDSAQ